VVQVLLALTIISTVAGVICAVCAAIALLQQRRQVQPQTVVIIVERIETPDVEPQANGTSKSDPSLESAA
jgi:hypothetical protein